MKRGDYTDYNTMDSTEISLNKVVEYIKNGRYKIPRFQRRAVWTDKMNEEFFDSIIKRFPIPSILLIENETDSIGISDTASVLGYDDIKDVKNPHSEPVTVLDGQQRLTAIYNLFINESKFVIDLHALDEYIYKKSQGLDYSDIKICIKYNRLKHEYKESKNEDAIHKAKGYIKTSEIFATYKNSTALNREIEEAKIFNGGKTIFEYKWRTYLNSEKRDEKYDFDEHKDLFRDMLKNIQKYNFQFLTLNEKYNLDAVIQIFEKLNTSGIKLSIFDLINAKTFNPMDENPSILEKIKEMLDKLDEEGTSIYNISNIMSSGERLDRDRDKKIEAFSLRLIKILYIANELNKKHVPQSSFNPSNSALLKQDGEKWIQLFNIYEKSLMLIFQMIDFNDLKFLKFKFLDNMIAIMLSKPELIKDNNFVSTLMRQDFILTISDRTISKDDLFSISVKFNDFAKKIIKSNDVEILYLEKPIYGNNLLKVKYKSNMGKYLYSWLYSFNKINLTGDKISDFNLQEKHHIIPKDSQLGRLSSSFIFDSIINIAPLSKKDNLAISNKEFESYREELINKRGIETIRRGFNSSFIKDMQISGDNLFKHREENILEHIENYIKGKIDIPLDFI